MRVCQRLIFLIPILGTGLYLIGINHILNMPVEPFNEDSLFMYIDNHKFKHDPRLQDAGDFERFKPTPEQQRKYKLIKWESDKYNK